jgi:putative DNA methylase
MGAHLIAIVTEGNRSRNYHSPTYEHTVAAHTSEPDWKPAYETSSHPQYMAAYRYGMTTFADLFTSRQLVAMTSFSDLIVEARAEAHTDALEAGLPDDGIPLHNGGRGALAYAEAVSVYLSFVVNRLADRCNSLSSWQKVGDKVAHLFARQAISMLWDYAEVNPFSGSSGNFGDAVEWVAEATESIFFENRTDSYSFTRAHQLDATATGKIDFHPIFSTDPPYYDSVPYADLSDFFYVWMRVMIGSVYPDIFNTILVPKSPELVADHQRYGGRNAANEHFENGMFSVFAGIREVTDQTYPVTVYYAFKQTDSDEDVDNSDNDSNIGGDMRLSRTSGREYLGEQKFAD